MKEPEENVRKSFGSKAILHPSLDQNYHSPLIEKIRRDQFHLKNGRLHIYLAKEFGFCYGVERAVTYAYETQAKFPDRRIFLTNEIIHNPRVNAELQDMGVKILTGDVSRAGIAAQDVVIMPAFGVPVKALEEFQKKGCVIVDTTCGSVMSVWRRVESYARDGFTSVIHGKYDHEETRATCSRAGKYLVVKDEKQAKLVCDFIAGEGEQETFLKSFENAGSAGFDPNQDLAKVGFANQTTMLSSESVKISGMLRDALGKRYGIGELPDRFRHFDTICSATQDRQDAVRELGQKKMDLILVIGGYKSSNTGHLAQIASAFCPAFHVEDAEGLVSREKIRHQKVGSQEKVETKGWLPAGEVKIGITAGASTPNLVVEEVIQRLIQIA